MIRTTRHAGSTRLFPHFRRAPVYLLCTILAMPVVSQADELTDLKETVLELLKRIEELEKAQEEQAAIEEETEERLEELEIAQESVDEKIGQRAVVQAFDALKLDFGGFVQTAYTVVNAEDAREGSFNRSNVELLLGAQFSESWTAFFAGGFLRESVPPLNLLGVGSSGPDARLLSRSTPDFDSNVVSPLIIGWANYRYDDIFNVRVGRMITPHGIINIEHFPATLLDPEQPQFLRPFSGDTIFSNFVTGIQVHGKTFVDDYSFEYASYFANTTASADEEQFGGRAAVGFANDAFVFGVNLLDGTRNDAPSFTEPVDASFNLFGFDFKIDYGPFLFKSEFYRTDEENDPRFPGLDIDRQAFYLQPAWRFTDKLIGFVRYDELDLGEGLGESTEVALGLNYLPTNNIRLRVIYTYTDFDDGFEDFDPDVGFVALPDTDGDIVQISGTFSF